MISRTGGWVLWAGLLPAARERYPALTDAAFIKAAQAVLDALPPPSSVSLAAMAVRLETELRRRYGPSVDPGRAAEERE